MTTKLYYKCEKKINSWIMVDGRIPTTTIALSYIKPQRPIILSKSVASTQQRTLELNMQLGKILLYSFKKRIYISLMLMIL